MTSGHNYPFVLWIWKLHPKTSAIVNELCHGSLYYDDDHDDHLKISPELKNEFKSTFRRLDSIVIAAFYKFNTHPLHNDCYLWSTLFGPLVCSVQEYHLQAMGTNYLLQTKMKLVIESESFITATPPDGGGG